MPCRLSIACLCCLVLVQAEARFARTPSGAPETELPAQLPLQQQERQPPQQQPPQQQQPEGQQPQPAPVSLTEAIAIAVKRYGGRATNAETVERNGRRVHQIRLFLEDGSVRTVRVNPDGGAILP
jgi:uncharacterized membrane protein YkoI